MKAAVLERVGANPVVRDVPAPAPAAGEVVVDVLAAPVISYAREIFDGSRSYPLVTPLIPGCGAIGRVVALGPDATRLIVGDKVFCDPTVRSRDDAVSPDIMLHGWFAGGDGAQKLQSYFRNGPFAEQMMLPLENAVPLGPAADFDAPAMCAVNTLLVPFGGLLAADLRPGETVVVNGGSGHFGSAGVAVALAMGARAVVATGRDVEPLDRLVPRFGSRVRSVCLTGDEDDDRGRLRAAAGGPIDRVLDLLPPIPDTTPTRTAIRSLRPHGTAVIMGGIRRDIALPYAELMTNNITLRGQFMYPRDAPIRLFGMIAAGLVSLEEFEIDLFRLDELQKAVDHAAEHPGPFRMTVVQP